MESLANWLTNSVLGILTLGAFSSLLAIFFLWLVKIIALKIIPSGWKATRGVLEKHEYTCGYLLGYAEAKNDTKIVILYLSRHICSMILGLSVSVLFSIVLAMTLILREHINLDFVSFSMSFLSSLCLFIAVHHFRVVLFVYRKVVMPIMQTAEESYSKKYGPNKTGDLTAEAAPHP